MAVELVLYLRKFETRFKVNASIIPRDLFIAKIFFFFDIQYCISTASSLNYKPFQSTQPSNTTP